MSNDEFLKNLTLPSRFEQLELESKKAGFDMSSIIQRVDSACEEIDIVLREVHTSQLGRLQILYGTSGSGKTTFLHGLLYFFDNIRITAIPNPTPIVEIGKFLERDSIGGEEHRLYVIHDRDNPNETDEDLRAFLEELRRAFRTDLGKVLVVWPITDLTAANRISDIAWDIGRDSLLGTRTKIYNFQGLAKESYFDVADMTTRALNAGENLESFGIDSNVADDLARSGCETPICG